MSNIQQNSFVAKVLDLIHNARNDIVRKVNRAMVYTYYDIGKIIVEEEQSGKERADYGKFILNILSEKLTKEFDKGFSTDNLSNMRKFYLTYSKSETLSRKLQVLEFQLSWSHYLKLIRIENEDELYFCSLPRQKPNFS